MEVPLPSELGAPRIRHFVYGDPNISGGWGIFTLRPGHKVQVSATGKAHHHGANVRDVQ